MLQLLVGPANKEVYFWPPQCRVRVSLSAALWSGRDAISNTATVVSPSLLSCCLTSTEARWPIRDGDRVESGRQSESSTAETDRKGPDRQWTAARTMEVLRRCPLAIAQRLVHCAIAVSTAVLDRVTKKTSVALLLTNNLDNSKQKMSNLLSPAPPPYS